MLHCPKCKHDVNLIFDVFCAQELIKFPQLQIRNCWRESHVSAKHGKPLGGLCVAMEMHAAESLHRAETLKY